MSIIVRGEDLLGDIATRRADANGAMLVVFDDPVQLPSEIRKLWGVVLLTALRDRATSVQYLPWRSNERFTYIIESHLRYQLPLTTLPPDEHAAAVIEGARSLFTAPPTRGLLSRFVRRAPESAVCSSFTLEVGGWSVLWDAVFWSNGERAGVELIRVTPLEEAPPA